MIDMKKFYLIGAILMLVAVLGSVWNLFLIWNEITIGAKIAQIATGVLFQSLLVILFFGLYKMMSPIGQTEQVLDTVDLNKLIKEVKKR